MSQIRLNEVSKRFGDIEAVNSVDLVVEEGEFFSLLGPSGSGKTTILQLIAGFLQPSSGTILIGNQSVAGLPPEHRDIGLVFQNYALFPHLSVFDNIAFGLQARKVPKTQAAQRVEEVLDKTGLGGYEHRRPLELSGGERQRVAVARALVIRPKVLLLDEPLGALDRILREQMQYWIKGIQNSTGVTTLYVTHDQVEALTMSDRVAVIHQGKILQVDTPENLYREPANRFVAEFMGDNNLVDASVVDVTDGRTVISIPDGPTVELTLNNSGLNAGDSLVLGIRPEDITLDLEGDPVGPNRYRGRVVDQIYRGSVTRYIVVVEPSWRVLVDTFGRSSEYKPGSIVSASWRNEHISLLKA